MQNDGRHDAADLAGDGGNIVVVLLCERRDRRVAEAERRRVQHRVADRREAQQRIIVAQCFREAGTAPGLPCFGRGGVRDQFFEAADVHVGHHVDPGDRPRRIGRRRALVIQELLSDGRFDAPL